MRRQLMCLLFAWMMLAAQTVTATAVTYDYISQSTTGQAANNSSWPGVVSDDGRYVAFESLATNLDPADTNTYRDVYLRDRQARTTTLITKAVNGGASDGETRLIMMSYDGKRILFKSNAKNLTSDVITSYWTYFIHDVPSGVTTLLGQNYGNPAMSPDGLRMAYTTNGYTYVVEWPSRTVIWAETGGSYPALSFDGRYMAFYSNFKTPDDKDGHPDIFLRDTVTGTIEKISDNTNPYVGYCLPGRANVPSLSYNGRYISFVTYYYNSQGAVYYNLNVRDRQTGEFTRASYYDDGSPLYYPDAHLLSGDGKLLFFYNRDWRSGKTMLLRDIETQTTSLWPWRTELKQLGLDDRLTRPISADFRYAVIYSDNNMAPEDNNSRMLTDTYLIDRGPSNLPPVADAGPDQNISCSGPNGATIALDGSASSDPDGDSLTYTWSGPFGTTTGATASVTVPMGASTITLTVDDGNGGTATDTLTVTVADTTPPATSALISGTAGNAGWYVSPVTITLVAIDGCSTVENLTYSVDGAVTTVQGGSATITLGDGVHDVSFAAVDTAGNEETQKSVSASVDATAPVITITGVSDSASYSVGLVPAASYSATDATSGLVSSSGTLTGGDAFGMGTFTYAVTATDAAGNSATSITAYQVVASAEGLRAIIRQMVVEGLIAPQMETPLMAKVDSGVLQAFINHVQAQAGKKIDAQAASALIKAAEYLKGN